MNDFHITINHFSRQVSSFFDDQLAEFGLATSYVELLLIIRTNGSCAQKEVSESLGLAPSTITRFVDKLVARGFIEKEKDGRESILKLTQKGIDTSRKMEVAYRDTEAKLREKLGDKYFETTGKLINFGIESFDNKP